MRDLSDSALGTDRRDARQYAVVFDFLGLRDPMFAALKTHGAGWTPSLKHAARFDDESAAQRFLNDSYGPATREFGVVVEVEGP